MWRGFEALPPYFGGNRRLCPRIFKEISRSPVRLAAHTVDILDGSTKLAAAYHCSFPLKRTVADLPNIRDTITFPIASMIKMIMKRVRLEDDWATPARD